MKTLKSVLTGIALLFICVAANATVKPIADKPTKTDIINTYIDAITHGKTNNIEGVLDNSMEYDIQRGDNVNALTKEDLLAAIKNAGIDANVTATTTIMADDDDASTVRVDFKYADYVRTDVVTLSKTTGWVITKVVTSYK